MLPKWRSILFFVIIALVFSVLYRWGVAEMSFSQIPQYVFRKNGSDPQKPMVALTFDDGPLRGVTDRILETLEKYGARATFFVLGENIKGAEDIIKKQKDLGCIVGNHSYSHQKSQELEDLEFLAEFEKTDNILKELCGEKASYIRPPFGMDGKRIGSMTRRTVILWSLDTLDWESQDNEEIEAAVFSQVQDGDIILMHDIFPSTAEACERLIPGLIKRGYQLVTVKELMEAKGIVPVKGEVYTDGKG